MSNLAQSQSEWNKLFRELGLFLGPIKYLRDCERKFALERNRTQLVEFFNNGVAFTSAWTLTGVVTPTATDENGKIFVRIANNTPGAGQATISLYNAVGGGGGNLVAQGVVTYPGTCTLTAQNGSGLSGTVVVGTVSASEANDLHYLQAFVDWPLRARSVFDNSKPEHGGEMNAFLGACLGARRNIQGAIAAWTVALTLYLSTRFSDFMGSSSSAAPISKATTNTNGAVATVYAGVLEDARKDMVDELTAGAQKILTNTITPGTPSFDGQNQGLGTMGVPTMTQWAQDGPITLVCTSAIIGSEQFQVTQRLTTTNQVLTALNPLQVKQIYADPTIGIQAMTLLRTLSFTAGGASTDFGAASVWTINGESSGNTNAGSLYFKLTASGGGSITSKIAIGAGGASKTFIHSYQNGTSNTITTGAGSNTATLVAADLNANTTFATNFLASATLANGTGSGTFLTISLKSTADGSYGLILNGTLNGQGGAGQDTFNNNTTIGTFRIDGYVSTLYTTSVQVCTSTLGTFGSTVTLTATGGIGGITGTAVIGTQPISGDTATLSLNCFQTQNANGVPDKITIAITAPNAQRGEFQDRIAELFGYALNSASSGSQTINEGYLTCGTFPPYVLRDA